MAGLLVALERVGVDLAAADRIIGTSAGAIIGAMLAGGVNLKALARRPATAAAGRAPERLEPTRSHEILAIMSTPGLERGEVRRRVGAIALADRSLEAQQAQLDRRRSVIGIDSWPQRDLEDRRRQRLDR